MADKFLTPEGAAAPDVPANTTCCDAIKYVLSKGLMKTDPDGIFRPNGPISRAEFADLLYKLQL